VIRRGLERYEDDNHGVFGYVGERASSHFLLMRRGLLSSVTVLQGEPIDSLPGFFFLLV